MSCLFFSAAAAIMAPSCNGSSQDDGPEPQPDPYLFVDINDTDRAYQGTTLFSDLGTPKGPRIVEVDMEGLVVWEYLVPEELHEYVNPGFDVEYIPTADHILFVLPRNGVYEVDRDGSVVWSFLDEKVSHDADRLEDGNTLVVWGGVDRKTDAQVREISPDGEVVWSWHARDDFDTAPWDDSDCQGWAHANAVSRPAGGNTFISLRNFNLIAEVNHETDELVRAIEADHLYYPHDPELQGDGTMLSASQYPLASCGTPPVPDTSVDMIPVVEFNMATGETLWLFNEGDWSSQLTRDTDRLPNGNTLITGTDRVIEVTADKQIVWRLIKDVDNGSDRSTGGFFKAERIGAR